jgi:uncharacterized protein
MDQAEMIARATKIIVERADPIRIVLFGSRGRGDAHKDSDLDLLIIVADGTPTGDMKRDIGLALQSAEASFDLILYTETAYERKRNEGWILFDEISRDGKVIYAA